jgi:hypothetical protein
MGANNKRKSLQEVKEYFKFQGCELLEDNYINAHTKMKYRCACGNISHIKLNNFQNGKRCGCGRKGVRLFSAERIKQEVESLGYKFISEKFENEVHTIICICRCGRERVCQLKNIRRGTGGCKKCLDKTNAANSFFMSGSDNLNWVHDRKRKKEDDLFRRKCRNILHCALKGFKLSKFGKTEELLGYTFQDLKSHIKNHPRWLEVKDKNWHLDHIFPLKAFAECDIKDVKLANCLENLQPLKAFDNLSKNDKYNKKDFENWVKSKRNGK